jgi:GTPase
MAFRDNHGLVAEAERGLARLDHEHLGIWMPMNLRAAAGSRVDEDDREGNVAVVRAHELVRVPARIELVVRDHQRVSRHRRRVPSDRSDGGA